MVLYSLCLVDLPDDDVGDEEELAVEEDVVGSEDEMADFIVDEDGNGHRRKYNFSLLYLSWSYGLLFSDFKRLFFFSGATIRKRNIDRDQISVL